MPLLLFFFVLTAHNELLKFYENINRGRFYRKNNPQLIKLFVGFFLRG